MKNQEQVLNDIVVTRAHEKFEKMYGFGLYHANEKVKAQEIKEARKEVDAWVERLRPAFEAPAA